MSDITKTASVAKKDKAAETDNKSLKTFDTAKIEKTSVKMKEEKETFIYIGPTLKTGIRENAVFTGTKSEIYDHLDTTFEKYPQAKQLLISVKDLAKLKSQVKKNGTLLNKYYTDLVSLSYRQ